MIQIDSYGNRVKVPKESEVVMLPFHFFYYVFFREKYAHRIQTVISAVFKYTK